MKSRILFTILFILVTIPASAQGRMRERPEPIDWVKKLDLTEAQSKQMADIQQNFRNKIMALRETPTGDPMEMMALMQDKQKARDKKIKKVLNKKQFKKYKKELKAQKNERRKRMKDRGLGQRRGKKGQRGRIN